MPKRRMENVEEVARREIDDEIARIVEALVAAEGPAADADALTDADVLRQWGQRDPKLSDADGLKAHLMQSGLPPELLDPNNPNALAVVKARPEIAEMYQSPCDEPLAHMLSRLAEYPLRIGILEPYQDDPETMVKVAEDVDRRWQRAGMPAAPEEGR